MLGVVTASDVMNGEASVTVSVLSPRFEAPAGGTL